MSVNRIVVTGIAPLLAGLTVFAFSVAPALAAPATPVTREAKSVTASSAVLNGELNPTASATAGYEFMYNTTSSGTGCEGGVTTTAASEKIGKEIPVSEAVAGLEGNTEYTFCVLATELAEPSAAGGPLTFTTLPAPPKVEGPPTGTPVTPFHEMVEVQVNPENQQTTSCVFEYGETTSYGKSRPCAQLVLEGSSDTTASASLTELQAATKYHDRIVVRNATGETKGADGEFTTSTALKPVVESEASSGVTPFAAKLEATVNPEFQKTTCIFEYSTSKALVEGGKGTPVSCNNELGSGSSGVGTAAVLTGLTPKTPYFYRVIATNETGTQPGATESFTTLTATAPVVENEHASEETPFEATLNAEVNPDFQVASCEFEYGPTAAYGTKVPCKPASLEGGSAQAVSVRVTGLASGKPYHFRVVAKNATGEEKATDTEFKTQTATAPVVTNEHASEETPFEATLNAEVDPDFQVASCEFEYGPTAAYGTKVSCKPVSLEGGTAQAVSVRVKGLASGATYHFRVVAKNATGEEKATDTEFKTQTATAPVIVSESVSEVTAFGAKLQAQVNPDYQATTTEFEYATEESVVLAGHGTTVSGPSVPTDSGAQSVSVDLGNVLEPETKYYYRVIATNATGTTENTGVIGSFKTLIEPIIGAVEAQDVTSGTAILSGTINPAGSATTYHFIYAPADDGSDARTTPKSSSIGSDYTTHPTGPITISELAPGTTYVYALVATNAQEVTVISSNGSFTTGPAPAEPLSTTEPIPTTAPQLPASPFTSTPAPAFIPYTSIAVLDATEAHENKGTGTTKKTKKSKKKKHTKHKKHNQKKRK